MNMNELLGGFNVAGHNTSSQNAFGIIVERLTKAIDDFGCFSRIDDVMKVVDPLGGMKDMVVAQINAAKGEGEEWQQGQEAADKPEQAYEDKGRMHITMKGSLKPIFSLFTIFNYVSPTDSAKKEELGRWTVTMTVRDKRIVEKYDSEFKNFSGNIFNESAFNTMLIEIKSILEYVIELDGIPVPDNPHILDLRELPYGQQMSIQQLLQRE